MGRLSGKVAFISGIARGQGRAHAIRLAEEGADIIGFDRCEPVATVPNTMGTEEDLAETVSAIEALDRRVLVAKVDVRDQTAINDLLADGVDRFGRLDIVVANAGIASAGLLWQLSDEEWSEMIDINLTGVWRTIRAAVPILISQDTGGSIIAISSAAGLVAVPRMGHYTAAKHGVTGLAKSLAVELAPYRIRSNSVHPGNVDTPMINTEGAWAVFTGQQDATAEMFATAMQALNAMPTPFVEPRDISNAVLYLASDEARWVTGTQLVVDAGNMLPFKVAH